MYYRVVSILKRDPTQVNVQETGEGRQWSSLEDAKRAMAEIHLQRDTTRQIHRIVIQESSYGSGWANTVYEWFEVDDLEKVIKTLTFI